MTGNSTVMNGDLTSLYVGFTLFVGGIVGGALNIHNIVAMCHIKDFSTSYGDLCKARAVFNIVNLSVFVFYVAPVTIFKYLPRGDEVGRILALIAAACYCAIPILQIVIAIGLACGILVSLHDVIARCRYVYIADDLLWVYEGCSSMIEELKFFYPFVVTTGISLSINMIVATRLLIRKIDYGTNTSEKRRNVKLFWQGFAQELFFANGTIWQIFLLNLINTRLWWFVSSMLMWELAHLCDSLVFLVFYSKLRYFLWSLVPANILGW
ncbi:hypothetical protein Aduo_017180 [Ancylostoma duodenale]